MDILSTTIQRAFATILRILIVPSFATFLIDPKPRTVFSISILNPVLYQLGLSHAQRIHTTPPVLYGSLEIKTTHPVKIQSLNICFERAAKIVGEKGFESGHCGRTEPRLQSSSTILGESLLPILLEPHKLYVIPFTMTLNPATVATVNSRFVSVEYRVSASALFVAYSNSNTATDNHMEPLDQIGGECQPLQRDSIQCLSQRISIVNCPVDNYYCSQTEALGNWRDILSYYILVPQKIYQGSNFVVEITILPFQIEKFKILGVSIKLIEIASTCKAEETDEEHDLTSDSDSAPDSTSIDKNVNTRVVLLHRQTFDEKFVCKCTDSKGKITIPVSLQCPSGGKFGKPQVSHAQPHILRTVTNKRSLGIGIKHKVEVQFRLEELESPGTCSDEMGKTSETANMVQEFLEIAGSSAIQCHHITDDQTRYDPIEMTFQTKVIILDSLAQDGQYLVPKYAFEPSSSVKNIPSWCQSVQPPPYK